MRFRKWVVTERQRRILLSLGLIVGAILAIGIVPPAFYLFLVGGIAYGLFKLILRIRRNQRGETQVY